MSELFMARLTTKGQITIPVELRRFLDLRAGDYIIFEKRDSRVEMKKMPAADLASFARPIRERFQERGITPQDVEDAIAWARGNKT